MNFERSPQSIALSALKQISDIPTPQVKIEEPDVCGWIQNEPRFQQEKEKNRYNNKIKLQPMRINPKSLLTTREYSILNVSNRVSFHRVDSKSLIINNITNKNITEYPMQKKKTLITQEDLNLKAVLPQKTFQFKFQAEKPHNKSLPYIVIKRSSSKTSVCSNKKTQNHILKTQNQNVENRPFIQDKPLKRKTQSQSQMDIKTLLQLIQNRENQLNNQLNKPFWLDIRKKENYRF